MADDTNWAAMIGPVIQGVSSYAGSQQAIGGQQSRDRLLEEAYKRALAMLESGQLSYAPERVAKMGPSAFEGAQSDPGAKLAQENALSRLQEASRSGFDEIDKASMNRAVGEANQQEKSQREAVLARLDPNSGAALAARLSAQQSGANRANQSALDIASLSRKRALDALGAYGNMAGKMRGQSWDEASGKAQGMDSISKFNSEIRRFNAQEGGLAAREGIANKLRALQLASGEGGRLGAGQAATAGMQGEQTAAIGKGLAGMVNAGVEGGKDEDEDD